MNFRALILFAAVAVSVVVQAQSSQRAALAALDALRAAQIPFRSNIRFIWEGEEEAGSPHLEAILNANRDLVHGDVWLVCDGPVDQSGQQTVVFGARGDTHREITVFGAIRGLHSGHYGNWAPNPAMMLAQLLAGMKDQEGNVLIPHSYDGISPLGTLEKQAIAVAPVNDDALRAGAWPRPRRRWRQEAPRTAESSHPQQQRHGRG